MSLLLLVSCCCGLRSRLHAAAAAAAAGGAAAAAAAHCCNRDKGLSCVTQIFDMHNRVAVQVLQVLFQCCQPCPAIFISYWVIFRLITLVFLQFCGCCCHRVLGAGAVQLAAAAAAVVLLHSAKERLLLLLLGAAFVSAAFEGAVGSKAAWSAGTVCC